MTGLKIIYEDNHLIAAIKPVGILSQGDATGDETILDLVKDYIKVRYRKPGDVFLGSIHRLDRPASGTMIFARTTKALKRMNELFRNHEIKKTYHIIVEGRLDDHTGRLIHFLSKDEKRNIVSVYNKQKGGTKKATLSYEVVGMLRDYSLLKVNLETGRPHQIRAQFAKIGHSVVADKKYGSTRKTDDWSICLHCSEMSFIHPVKKEEVIIAAPLPEGGFWKLFD